MKIEFYNNNQITDSKLTYVIICSRFKRRQWICVKHRERNTWEIPGGHIEPNEQPIDAARRELFEETGAVVYSINAIFDYSVTNETSIGYGRVFFAEVEKLDCLPESEIIEINFFEKLPELLTYPMIQPLIFEKALSLILQEENEAMK
jgi:8-oxo-dGTP diphosphatase